MMVKAPTTKTALQMRDMLFRRTRPLVRRLEIMDGDQYTKDTGVLWAAYKAGSFPDIAADLDEAAFLVQIENLQKLHDQVWIIDDFNAAYKDKRGPVALACTKAFELVINAEGCVFKWATRRNVLRCSASFLQMIRRSRMTGICMVKCNKATTPLMRHLEKYRLLYYVGKAAADSYLYAVRGRASEV